MAWLVLCVSYVVSSWFFTKYPERLPWFLKNRKNWRKNPGERKDTNLVHISHRGGCGEFYENTMDAFRGCAKIGTDMLELDVQLTKDGVVVVSHDQNLKRLTGCNVNIKDINYADLPKIQREIPVEFDGGVKFSSFKADEESISIPTLEQVFRNFPEVSVNIDIKIYDEDLIREVGRLVEKYGRANNTVWGNFGHKTTRRCHEENPKIGLLFSERRVFALLLYFYAGLLPYVTLPETHLEIPMPCVFFDKFSPDSITTRQRVVIKSMDFLLMRRRLFEHLAQRGIPTYVWVLNKQKYLDRAFNELGVTGVMTDYPTLLKSYLERR